MFTYHKVQRSAEKYCAIRIMLFTADGRDYAGSALIKKAKPAAKGKTEDKPAQVAGRLSTAKVKDGVTTITLLQDANSAAAMGDVFNRIDKRSAESQGSSNQIKLAVTSLARIIHEGKEEKAFDVVKSRCDTSFHYKKSLLNERYHTTECSI